MSRRDLAHLMTALWELSGAQAGVEIAVAALDEAVGRGRGDMRTPLNLQSLAQDGIVAAVGADAWALTPEGVARIAEDRELSDR
jgi:hypothetical protein